MLCMHVQMITNMAPDKFELCDVYDRFLILIGLFIENEKYKERRHS